MDRPKLVVLLTVLVTVILAAAMVRVEVDTDPENMLPDDNPVRVLNRSMRSDFGTTDMIVLGIINENGVVTGETLAKASRLIDEIKTLPGVIPEGVVSFKSAIDVPTEELSPDDVDRVADAVDGNPILTGRVISPDRKALAIYVPLESKGDASGVSADIKALLKSPGLEVEGEHYLAGLPLAEETFGHDMFIQMGLLAPLAGMLVFILMLYFFRRLLMVIAAMLVHAQRHLDHGPADRHRLHGPHLELHDSGVPHAHRHPGQYPHPQRVLRPVSSLPGPASYAPSGV
jgi:predicted RND superfamily exporter protein